MRRGKVFVILVHQLIATTEPHLTNVVTDTNQGILNAVLFASNLQGGSIRFSCPNIFIFCNIPFDLQCPSHREV